MMGEISGLNGRMLRDNPKTAAIPVIFLTARIQKNDKLTGFNIGADDYISKPFSIREVLARVKAVLRRIENKNWKIHPMLNWCTKIWKCRLAIKKCFLNGEEIPFTKKEFEILRAFSLKQNRVFTREEMLTRVWSDVRSYCTRPHHWCKHYAIAQKSANTVKTSSPAFGWLLLRRLITVAIDLFTTSLGWL